MRCRTGDVLCDTSILETTTASGRCRGVDRSGWPWVCPTLAPSLVLLRAGPPEPGGFFLQP